MKQLAIILLSILILSACSSNSYKKNSIIIGINGDIENLSPLYAFSVNEGSISELLYLSLVDHKWNDEKNELEHNPMLAKGWEWHRDSNYVKITLKDNILWSDSMRITSKDVLFSFQAYSDTSVQSKFLGQFNNYFTDEAGQISPEKSFKILSPNEIIIFFRPDAYPTVYDFDFPILPAHTFNDIERSKYIEKIGKKGDVTSGPYTVKEWKKFQHIILSSDSTSLVYNKNMIPEVIFKVVPEYISLLTQLKSGEIDMMEGVNYSDISELQRSGDIVIAPVKGRDYSYVGWMNINEENYQDNGTFEPHPLFGDPAVRKALTMAINRNNYVTEQMKEYFTIAHGPISPVYYEDYNTVINPLPYAPDSSRKLLEKAGWKDTNGDMTLDKDGKEFNFNLYYSNTKINNLPERIKNDLAIIGVKAQPVYLGYNKFIEDMMGRKLDAWISGWFVPMPAVLKPYWHSDLEASPLNFQGYRSVELDKVITRFENSTDPAEKEELLLDAQKIIRKDQPVTFLYWNDFIAAYNNRIKNVSVNPLGIVHHCWEWTLN